jgi:cation diffusion facilitator family transporter
MATSAENTRVVYAALIGNLLIAASKFVAAVLTGSSAMLSEGVHSLVDTGNEVLLLYGLRRAAAPPDKTHPFGYGREMYFWNFIVALLIFALGSGVSLFEGIDRLRHPQPVTGLVTNYVVLAVAFVFEGASWTIAFRSLRASKGALGYFEAMRRSKDPSTFTVLLEDSAALTGLIVAAFGITLAHVLEAPAFDAAASIVIALLLATTSWFLARETKGLLLGESALPQVSQALLRIAGADGAVAHANGVLTAQLGPEHVLAALSAEFEDAMTAPEIEACVTRIEKRIMEAHPEITMLFVKPQTRATWVRRRDALDDGPQ